MHEEIIKPCPFCGMHLVKLLVDSPWTLYQHPESDCFFSTLVVSKTEIEKWNTRKPMERIVERLEERYNDIPIQYETSYEEGLGDGIDYAINVVKGGGVDG